MSSQTTSLISAPFDVEKIREDFPVLKQFIHGKPLVYLDSAATAQKPTVVVDSIRHFHEAETFAAASVTVSDDFHGIDGTALRKCVGELLLSRRKGKISNV